MTKHQIDQPDEVCSTDGELLDGGGRCGTCDESSARGDGRWHRDRTPLGDNVLEWAARPLPEMSADNDWGGAFDGLPDFSRRAF